MKRVGFSLVECMVYVCIMMLLSFFATEFFARNYLQLNSYIKKNNSLMSLYAAQDALSNDLALADDDEMYWIQKTNELICKTIQSDVGWHVHNKTLYRVSGEYDFNRQQWNKKNKALIAPHVTAFSYWLERKNKRVVSVQSNLAVEDMEPITHVTWLSQRILP